MVYIYQTWQIFLPVTTYSHITLILNLMSKYLLTWEYSYTLYLLCNYMPLKSPSIALVILKNVYSRASRADLIRATLLVTRAEYTSEILEPSSPFCSEVI